MTPKVLVATTTRWFPTARLATALSRAGFVVEAVCPSGHPLRVTGVASRIHPFQGLRPLNSLADAIAAKPDFIVSGDDLATYYLHQLHRREMDRGNAGAPICALIERSFGSPESFPITLSRAAFMDIAREQGVRSPKTNVIAGVNDLRISGLELGLPMILKADGTSGGDGVRIVTNLDEAEGTFRSLAAPPSLARAIKRSLFDHDNTRFTPSLLRRGPVVNAQAFIRGREATSTVACWKGCVLASLHFEVVKKGKASGHSTVLRVSENAEMSVAVEKMARRLQLSGIHGFDFMLDAETGKAHLIEINPRSTQVSHLTFGPNHDLPAALYAAVSGEPVKAAPKITENDTIALFPQEWIRDVASPHLHSGYHDVPWEEPDLVRACILSRKKKALYSKYGNARKIEVEQF